MIEPPDGAEGIVQGVQDISGMTVAFVGFGEAAQAFVEGWGHSRPGTVSAFDIKTTGNGAVKTAKLKDYARRKVDGQEDLSAALKGADVILSLVTADQAVAAAQAAAGCLSGTPLYFDCNSCAPQSKAQAALAIEGAGGRYVDVAVMSPVRPLLHKAPLLVSGPHAKAARDTFATLDMTAKVAGTTVGEASAIKLCRSIIVKGLEALTAEMILTARELGVEVPVLESLEASYPGVGWQRQPDYALERMSLHGQRRAAEMEEAVTMIEGLGLPARMSRNTVTWQRQVSEFALGLDDTQMADRAQAILKRLRPRAV